MFFFDKKEKYKLSFIMGVPKVLREGIKYILKLTYFHKASATNVGKKSRSFRYGSS